MACALQNIFPILCSKIVNFQNQKMSSSPLLITENENLSPISVSTLNEI